MNGLVSQLNYPLRRSARLLSVSSIQVDANPDLSQSTPTTVPRKRRNSERDSNSNPLTDEGHVPLPASKKSTINPAARKSDTVKDLTRSVKSKAKSNPKPDPVYSIPDVEPKETQFKGRLGYACLNTVLRNKKPSSASVFCSRTCRLDSLRKNGLDWVKELGRRNVEDLLTIIQWNEDNNIRFFRLSSEMFPFASHAVHGYSLEYCASQLAKAGALANKYRHRLTVHPGQYTQLGSPKPAVVEAAVRELVYHCQMLDLMGLGKDSVMVIHGGGVYNDKPTTLQRLKESIRTLPSNVRNRLVLENDEMCYNAKDLLPVCEELDVPLVFDYHHDALYPSSIPPSTIIKRANAIWTRRGIKPKQHLSEQRPGAVTLMERRAHADRCENLPEDLPLDMDLMIEAKDKEQAVLYLHRMYNLKPVVHASLRPAATNPSTQTNGRKSNKRGRATPVKERGVTEGE
ncbi:hypothetical protein GALMADRAFT_249051 [Galerina marginata CBS 339.88]|uniref:UV-endonuclease UvdE n=1 Tax=Galerina marginata (strain CBS 339.88) TaxID=685588 RepID=A0A067SYI2_GALM3|nr:hypothetical protein GALMADRAFT_249051 [Galerina marginata CBS 339.88]